MTRHLRHGRRVIVAEPIQHQDALKCLERDGTNFTREEISDIIDLGMVLRKIHNRLDDAGKIPKSTPTNL